MTDYLTRLAQRAVTAAPAVRPRLPSAYEAGAGPHPSAVRTDGAPADLAAIQPEPLARTADPLDEHAAAPVPASPLDAGSERVARPSSPGYLTSPPGSAEAATPRTGSIRASPRSPAASGVRRSESAAAPASSLQAATPAARAISRLTESEEDQVPPRRPGSGDGERPELPSDAAAMTGHRDAAEGALPAGPHAPLADRIAVHSSRGVAGLPRDAENLVLPPATPRSLTSDQPVQPAKTRHDPAQSGDQDRPLMRPWPDRRFVEPTEIRPRARSHSAVETGRLQADASAVTAARSRESGNALAPEEPVVQRDVHVTIGRVEIRARLAPTPPARRPRTAAPGLSLESYLQRPNGAAR